MDLHRFFSVIYRFRSLILSGFLLACLVAVFSYMKVGPHGLSYRQQEVWISNATVLVTTPAASEPDATTLATQYAAIVTSDEVRAAAIRIHGIRGKLQGTAGFDPTTQTPLPTFAVSGLAASRLDASILANDGVVAVKAFIGKLPSQATTRTAKRPTFSVLQRATPVTAKVFTPRSKTAPVFAFVLVLAATLGLAFLLENLRPRVRPVPVEFDVEVPRASNAARKARNS